MSALIERLAEEALACHHTVENYVACADCLRDALRAFQAEAAQVARDTREIPGVDFNPEAGEKSHGEEIAAKIESL